MKKFIIENHSTTQDIEIFDLILDVIKKGETFGLQKNKYNYVNSYKVNKKIVNIQVKSMPYGYKVNIVDRFN